jgi:large subunit ribosomal protein L21
MSYAIISVGGKQYRVREGERLLVDRMKHDAGATFTPSILLAGGDGDPQLSPDDVVVTARVVAHVRGPKLRIFKFKPKSGYRRTTGFRSALTQIEIESIGAEKKRSKAKAEKPAEPKAAAPETATADKTKAEKPAKPEATAPETAPAEKAKAEKAKAEKAKAEKAKAEKPAKPKAEKPKPAEPEAETATEEAPAEKPAKPKAEKPKPAEPEAAAAETAATDEAPAEKPKPKAARKPRAKKTTEEGS